MAPTTVSSSSPAVARPITWAQIVKGESAAEPEMEPEIEPKEQETATEEAVLEEEVQPLRPARRGERLCRCVGQVLVMLRHYGWIAPLDPIEHPDSHKNGGRIYVAAADVEPGNALATGDRVSFFLYVDMQGLGAEGCCLASSVPSQSPRTERSLAAAHSPAEIGFSAGAAEFIPASLSASAAEFVPTTASTLEPAACALSAEAAVFKPGPRELSAGAAAFEPMQPVLSAKAAVFEPRPQRLLLPQADEFVPNGGMSARAAVFVPAKPTFGSVLQFNDAYFSDSEDEDEGAEAGDELSSQGSENELSDGSVESADYPVPAGLQGQVEWDGDLDVVVLCAPLKESGAALSAGSTSAGEHSDSEDELVSSETPEPLVLVGMPPGLSVLAS